MTPETIAKIKTLMAEASVFEEDLEETFILGGGPGGQKTNKTSSVVRLFHPPSGLQVRCGENRSREINRWLARRTLAERILAREQGRKSAEQQAREKKRRQKRRRSAARSSACSTRSTPTPRSRRTASPSTGKLRAHTPKAVRQRVRSAEVGCSFSA